MARLSRRWRQLTRRHVQALERYADAVESMDARMPAPPIDATRVARVRALARRIAQFVDEGRGGFGTADARLLSAIGEELVRERSTLGERPYEAPEPVKFRIGLGSDILGVRDRVQQFTRI